MERVVGNDNIWYVSTLYASVVNEVETVVIIHQMLLLFIHVDLVNMKNRLIRR